MAGHVDGFFGDIPGLMGQVRNGKLKPVAIAATRRHPLFPEVKTFQEIGVPGVDSDNWYALFATKGTPPAQVALVNQALRKALTSEAVKTKLMNSGAAPAPSTPADLAALIKSDTEKWSKVVRSKNIKPD